MAQHFLLSAKARSLSIADIARMSDDEAYSRFKAVRFADNGGEPFCPYCGSLGIYEYRTRRIFKCKGCLKQFSLTSKTLFASHKLPLRDLLLAIALFVNGVSGGAALKLSRDLKRNYKTAFVLAHKLRDAISGIKATHKLKGIVDIDGVIVGGIIKKGNLRDGDKRKPRFNPAKRRVIVNMRERGKRGRTLSFVFKHESEAIDAVLKYVDSSAKIRTDEAAHWDILHAHFANVRRVNHKVGYSIKRIHTNFVESLHSRIRHGERGVYHHIAGPHLQAYADEFGWREDFRRRSTGQQFSMLLQACAKTPVSKKWKGYSRRRRTGLPLLAQAA